jgi:recombinational DNA repair ATPase RecF
MYLRNLHVRHVKLLRDVEIDFTDSSGQPRMWTVFVGENRLCKTTLLQTIAAAASGTDRGTQLVTDVVAWSTLHRGLLGRAQPFRALSHDALATLVDPGLRERHGLRLPRPA